jgi:hypothetical protein
MSQRDFAKLQERDGYRCIHCGTTEGLVPHHRKNRKMGGSKRLEVASNVVLVCSLLNGLMESDPETQRWARERGWKLREHQDPKQVPVQDNTTNSMWLLHDDYTRTEVAE